MKDFSDHVCPGHGSFGKKNIRIEATHYGSVFLDKYIDYGCVLCAQEAKKEFDWRRIHAIKQKKNLEISNESLVKNVVVSLQEIQDYF